MTGTANAAQKITGVKLSSAKSNDYHRFMTKSTPTIHPEQQLRGLLLFCGSMLLLVYAQWITLDALTPALEQLLLPSQWQNFCASFVITAIGLAISQPPKITLGQQNLGTAKTPPRAWLLPLVFIFWGGYISVDLTAQSFFNTHLPLASWNELSQIKFLTSSVTTYINQTVILTLTYTLLISLLLLPPVVNYLAKLAPIRLYPIGKKPLYLVPAYIIISLFISTKLTDPIAENAYGAIVRQLYQAQLKQPQEDPSIDLYSPLYVDQNQQPKTNTGINQQINDLAERLRSQAQNPNQPLNIVLVVLESVGAEDLMPQGNLSATLTPNIYQLSQQGLLFDSLYINVNRSEHQNLAMMTGGFQPTWEQPADLLPQPYQGSVLARELQRHDYQTALFAATDLNYRHMREFINRAGYDFSYDFGKIAIESQDKYRINSWGGDDRHFIAQAGQWLKQVGQKHQPFFLHYLSNAPHHPYNLPEDVALLYPSNHGEGVSSRINHMNSLHYIDQALGTLIDQLKADQQLNNTLLIITGDHPAERRGLSEQALKSFLLLAAPGHIEQPLRSHRPISHGDVMPSLLALLAPKQSTNNLNKAGSQNLFSSQYQPTIRYFHNGYQPYHWGLIDGSWKYMAQGVNQPALLFNLEQSDTTPLEAPDNAQMADYKTLVENWYLRNNRHFHEQLANYQPIDPLIINPENLQHSGPSQIRFGLLTQSSPQMDSPIRLQQQQEFHPQAKVAAWISWLNPAAQQLVKLRWINPAGQQYTQRTLINPKSSIIHAKLDLATPLLEGQWQLQLVRGQQILLSDSFTVSTQTEQPKTSLINSLKAIEVGQIKRHLKNFLPKYQLLADQTFSIYSRWFRQDLAQQYRLQLLSPEGKSINFFIKLQPGRIEHFQTLNPPVPLSVGIWQVIVYAEQQRLGSTKFQVIAPKSDSNPDTQNQP
ncbi:MAG: LTA synthase family protein [Halopseudomonas sp.]